MNNLIIIVICIYYFNNEKTYSLICFYNEIKKLNNNRSFT